MKRGLGEGKAVKLALSFPKSLLWVPISISIVVVLAPQTVTVGIGLHPSVSRNLSRNTIDYQLVYR